MVSRQSIVIKRSNSNRSNSSSQSSRSDSGRAPQWIKGLFDDVKHFESNIKKSGTFAKKEAENSFLTDTYLDIGNQGYVSKLMFPSIVLHTCFALEAFRCNLINKPVENFTIITSSPLCK